MKQKISIIIFLLFAFSAQAVDLLPIQRIGYFSQAIYKIKECKWNISCYFTPKLGVALTSITGSTKVSDLDTILTNNFTALNSYKTETSSSSINAITTLSNLVTVGALTSGSLSTGFTAVGVALGGTGSTTLAINRLLVGSSTNAVATIGIGTSGQVLTSNGAGVPPSFQTYSIVESGNYNWTGGHTFHASSTFTDLNIDNSTTTSATTTNSNITTAKIATLNVTGTASTSAYLLNYRSTTTAKNLDTAAQTTKTTDCPSGLEVISGGYTGLNAGEGSGNDYYFVQENYPSSDTAWTVTVQCYGVADSSEACTAGVLTVYAICADIRK